MNERIVLTTLKKTRTDIGLTQEELASMVDITPRTIQRIESGNPTSLSTAKSIASVLELESYEMMTVAHPKKIRPQLIQLTEKYQKLKIGVFEKRQSLLLFFTAFISALLMIPVQGAPQTLAMMFFALTPVLTISVLTLESKDSHLCKPPTFRIFTLLTLLSVTAQASIPIFAALSMTYVQNSSSGTALARAFITEPGPTNLLTSFMDNNYWVWVISGGVALSSLLAIHYLIRKARSQCYQFGNFSNSYVSTFLFCTLTSLLLQTKFFSGLQPSNLYVCITLLIAIGVAAYYYTQYQSSDTKDERYTAKAGVLCFTLPPAIVITSFSLLYVSHIETYEFSFDYATKAIYCDANIKKDICWDARLLKKHNITPSEDNLMLLSSRNGNVFATRNVTQKLKLPKTSIQQSVPLPASLGTFLALSYARALEYKTHQGSLTTWTNSFIDTNLSVLLEPTKHYEWSNFALHDKEKFIRDFDIATYSVRQDTYLKSIHTALTGRWKIMTHRESEYYSSGHLHFEVKDGRVVDTYKTITMDDIDRILLIDKSHLPSFFK